MSHKLNGTQNIGNMLANQMSIFTTFFAMAPSSGQNELIHVTLTFLRFLTKIFNQKFREMLKKFQTAFNFRFFFSKIFEIFLYQPWPFGLVRLRSVRTTMISFQLKNIETEKISIVQK